MNVKQLIIRIILYIIASIIASVVYSFVTASLILVGIEEGGGDIGAPGIMLGMLLLLCIIGSFFIAIVIEMAKSVSNKTFPAKISIIVFLLLYLPIHISENCFPGQGPDFLIIIFPCMMFLSFVPFYHAIAQSLINIFEYLKGLKDDGRVGQLKTIFVIVAIGVFFLLVGWKIFNYHEKLNPDILSVSANWVTLETRAHEWQNDAYTNIIWVYSDEIKANFYSKSVPEEMIQISISRDGEITSETRSNSPMNEMAQIPIKRSDWTIDSTQVWTILKENELIRSRMLSRDGFRYNLTLDRSSFTGELYWELDLWNCSEEEKDCHFYLDPQTGEIK